MNALYDKLSFTFANMSYHSLLRNMNYYAFDSDMTYTVLERCCKDDHFIYVLMILTNPNVAFHFEGSNIIVDRINQMFEITNNTKIKDMLSIVLSRVNNNVVDIDTTKAPALSCAKYDWHHDVLLGPYPKRLFAMTAEQDSWVGEARYFLKCVCRDNHVAYVYAILAGGPLISYFYTRYDDIIFNELIELTNNQFIKDAIICVRDLAMPN